jgi:uncharacterized protein (TIGR02452 family)
MSFDTVILYVLKDGVVSVRLHRGRGHLALFLDTFLLLSYGADWVSLKIMNRQNRALMGQETLSIMGIGKYQVPNGPVVSIADAMELACAGSRLYRPGDYGELMEKAKGKAGRFETVIGVSNRTTLEAGREMVSRYGKVTCLNFASAKNPGGGFLAGSQAQEESLARSSGLYATLQMHPEYYDYHRRGDTCLYSDHTIFSPEVPVFRDDQGLLLKEPWPCSFITAAAVNAGAVRRNEPEQTREIVPIMEHRTRMILAVAVEHGCENLVLGAWGCGVFQNDPREIAGIFELVLREDIFAGAFGRLEFAVLDGSGRGETYRAFEEQFGLENGG